ncbi:hypothetical protein ES705_10495 [subsurface metagenome]
MPHNHSPGLKQVSVSNFPSDYFKQGQRTGGARIPDGALQIAKADEVANNTATIHTVGGGVVFYLTSVFLDGCNNSDALGYASMVVADATHAIKYTLGKFGLLPKTARGYDRVFFPPLEIPATWNVDMISEADNLVARGSVQGYEI